MNGERRLRIRVQRKTFKITSAHAKSRPRTFAALASPALATVSIRRLRRRARIRFIDAAIANAEKKKDLRAPGNRLSFLPWGLRTCFEGDYLSHFGALASDSQNDESILM
jgi:hypothetical protein